MRNESDNYLIGSDLWPSMVPLPNGKQMQLGDLVRRAAKGFAVDQWNLLDQKLRDGAMLKAYLALQTELGKVYPYAYEIAYQVHRMQRGDYSDGTPFDLCLKVMKASRTEEMREHDYKEERKRSKP